MTDAPGALSPLDEDGINAAVEEALAAFAAAGTLAELKEARLAHTGDASPLTLANRLIGTLDKADKPTAGKLLGGARGRIAKALTARQETLEAAAEEEMLRAYLAAPVTVFLGLDDTGDEDLVTTRTANRQGENRLDRGLNLFEAAREAAESRGWPFNWRLVTAGSIGHEGGRMMRSPEMLDAMGLGTARAGD